MTALINQELAKIEKRDRAYGGRSADPAMDAFSEAWKMGQEAKKSKIAAEDRELRTISSFEARLGNRVNNYMASGDIYDESKLQKLKENIESTYSQYSTRNPELISEFSDERDSILGVINNYSTKNKEKDSLLSKIEPTKQKLYSIVETLNTTATTDFTPDEKVKFRQEVYNTMEEITKLDKIIDDPYFSNLSGWADVAEDVKYGLSDASKQLITQINTWDSKNNVISPQDLDNLERAIFKNDTQGIRAVNEKIVGDKTARMTQYEKDYNTHLKNYSAIASYADTQTFKDLQSKRMEEFNKLGEKEKEAALSDPAYWFEYVDPQVLPGAPEEGINLQDVQAQKIKLRSDAEDIDAKYRAEHIQGSSIAEILNKPLPWSKRKKSLNDKKDEFTPTFTGEVGESLTGEEYDALQELQKDIEPEAGGETVEINNPGNLRFVNQTGSTGKDDRGFAIFPTPEEGWDALYRQIELDKGRDLTLDKFVNKYAPPSENDTTAYRNFLQKELNVGKNTNINKLDTQKLAVAIAKQEGYAGDYPELEGDPKPKTKGLKVDSPLTEVKDGKTVVNYGSASSTGFIKQQRNLKKIASKKFDAKGNKRKYKNFNNFAKSKFEEWLKSAGKYGKYAEGDFKYFFPTRVDHNNKINSNADMNLYNLYYPGAFKGAETGKIIRGIIKPKIGSGYLGFAKDFDEFRKFLQES